MEGFSCGSLWQLLFYFCARLVLHIVGEAKHLVVLLCGMVPPTRLDFKFLAFATVVVKTRLLAILDSKEDYAIVNWNAVPICSCAWPFRLFLLQGAQIDRACCFPSTRTIKLFVVSKFL